MRGVVGGCGKISGAGIVELRLLLEEKVAGRFAHPESGIGVDVHRFLLQEGQKIRVVAEDLEYLSYFVRCGETEAGVGFAGNHVVLLVFAEWLSANHHNVPWRSPAKHLQEDTAMSFVFLADTDESRTVEVVVECEATLLEDCGCPWETDFFA